MFRGMVASFVIILLVMGLASLSLTLVTHVAVLAVKRSKRPDGPIVPISVLKPLKGADPGLYDNLVSLAEQDYPDFEIVLGCEDAADPAIAVARRLAATYPDMAIRAVAGGRSIGLNPKINNLRHIAEAARHDVLLISDADVRVGPGYLRALAAELVDPKVGLVSNVIRGVGERSLGASLE